MPFSFSFFIPFYFFSHHPFLIPTMKNLLRSVVAPVLTGVALLSVPASGYAQSEALSAGMNEMFRVAEGHNASLQAVRTAIREAEAGIASARTAKLPEITGSASVSYLGNARLWNRHFGERTSAPMPHYGNNFLLHAEQVLYTGGAIRSQIALAGQAAQQAVLTAEEQRQQVRFGLVSMYLQLHCLHNQQEVYATNKALAAEQIQLMNKRHEQGVTLHNDVTRYELQLEQYGLNETTVADQQLVVKHQLYTALGTDSLRLRWLDKEAFDEKYLASSNEVDWQRQAAEHHFGLKSAALAVDMSRTREQLVRSERLPKLALLAEDHLDGPITIEVPPINKNLNYWFVGVGVSYNFSSLYKSKKRLREAQLATTFANDRRTEAMQRVDDAVHAAYVGLGTARTALATCRKRVQLAAENYEIVAKRYQNGLAIMSDLTDAANVKLDAELSLENARINLVQCYYALKYAAHAL